MSGELRERRSPLDRRSPKLLSGDFVQDVDLRTSIEEGANRASERFHMFGFTMKIECGLVLVDLVIHEI